MQPKSTEKHKNQNRLMHEKSPYLLQHADNPVDWYPWSNEAFEKAGKEDKPIFLSIGYSTCHWCHVMAHESFDDETVANLLNQAFVAIKVDREERPDIDNIYMTVCQMITGGGGWPLTIIMTPDKKPFYAGTYIPRDSRFGQVGMIELLPRIAELWKNRKKDIIKSADQIIEALGQAFEGAASAALDESALNGAFIYFENNFDRRFAGFGRAPKFPTPHNLLFLLRYWKRTGNVLALDMVESTLRAMRQGGIFDHLGLGFHRYSTDPEWLIPHFEKMLYDQALLALVYAESFQATGIEFYRRAGKEIFSYVLRNMTDESGGFHSAEDADSEGREGKFYLWRQEEILLALSEKDAQLAIAIFNVKPEGNFLDPHSGDPTGENILHLSRPLADIAKELNLTEIELLKKLESIRKKLLAYRERRPRPHKDDKILSDWNGLMIAALASGSQAFDEPAYAAAAARAADFILNVLRSDEGRLLHRFREGYSGLLANLDDYAFLIWGLLELYEATFETKYLDEAIRLNDEMIELFWDFQEGGFFFTPKDAEDLPVRQKEIYDGAIPSGNSVAALNLMRLGRITGNITYERKASNMMSVFGGQVRQAPQAYTMLLSALNYTLGPSFEIVVVGNSQTADTEKMLKALHRAYLPNKVVVFRPAELEQPPIDNLAEFVREHKTIDNKATAYVCREYMCNMPTTDIEEMLRQLGRFR